MTAVPGSLAKAEGQRPGRGACEWQTDPKLSGGVVGSPLSTYRRSPVFLFEGLEQGVGQLEVAMFLWKCGPSSKCCVSCERVALGGSGWCPCSLLWLSLPCS